MYRKILLVFCIILGLLISTTSSKALSVPLSPWITGIRLVQGDGSSVVFDLVTPEFQIDEITHEGKIYHQIKVPDYGYLTTSGSPELPFVAELIGIPHDVNVELRVLHDIAEPIEGKYRILPSPQPKPLVSEDQPGEMMYLEDKTIYEKNEIFPSSVARITSDGWLRDIRTIRVELYPFQYNPIDGSLLWHKEVRVEIRFNSYDESNSFSTTSSTTQFSQDRNAFDAVLKSSLLNYDQAQGWRNPSKPDPDQLSTSHTVEAASDGQQFKIIIEEDGIYRISYGDLVNELIESGIEINDVDFSNFRMTSQGQEIAIYLSSGNEAPQSGDPIRRIHWVGISTSR